MLRTECSSIFPSGSFSPFTCWTSEYFSPIFTGRNTGTKVRRPPYHWAPLEPLTLRLVHTDLPAIFQLRSGFSIIRLPRSLSGKESPCQRRRRKRRSFHSRVGKIPERRNWQPTPVFLPGESHEQRSLAGYSPWGRRESGTAARPHSRVASAPGSCDSLCPLIW